MRRPAYVVLLSLLLFTSQLVAQHEMQQVKKVDGAQTPMLIPDSTAYRLWFVVQGTNPNASRDELLTQRGRFKKLGLSDDDSDRLSGTLTKFKVEYKQLIDEYNSFVKNVYPAVTEADLRAFLTKRDALVDKFVAQAKQELSPRGASRLNSIIQSEKAYMILQMPDSTQ